MTSVPRPIFFIVALLLALISFIELNHRSLADPDEGRYSEIAREMAATNDFVTPRLNGLKYFEKPPLQYWATAIAFKVFGVNEFSARLYTFLCGLGCIFLVGYTATRLYDEDTGAYAVLALVSSFFFTAFTQVVTLDMGLTFWMTLGICSFVMAHGSPHDLPGGLIGANSVAQSRRRWMLMAWIGMAGAVLSKSLIGIVFPSAAIFLYCLTQGDWRLLKKLEWTFGLLLFFAITAPWFVAISLENPEFFQFHFIHEHFTRFASNTHRREAPWYTFFLLLPLGLLPWGLALLPAAIDGWRNPHYRVCKPDGTTFAPLKFILLFCIFVLLFFTKSNSKLPHYILPLFPLLAIVIGVYLNNTEPKKLAWLMLPTVLFGLGGAYAIWKLDPNATIWIAGVLVFAFLIMVAFIMLRSQQKWHGAMTLAIATVALITVTARNYDEHFPKKVTTEVAQSIKKYLTPETRLYAINIYDQSLPFNLKRIFTLVEYVDEFEMGQKAEPKKHIARMNDLPAAWNAPGPAMAIIQPGDVEKLKALGIGFDIIYRDERRLAIRKIP